MGIKNKRINSLFLILNGTKTANIKPKQNAYEHKIGVRKNNKLQWPIT